MRPSHSPKCGEVRADGRTFVSRNMHGEERWLSPPAYQRYRLGKVICQARRTAKRSGVPITITIDYLHSIFPKDHLCPVFGTPIVWGVETDGKRENCPSLDRRVPTLGYVPGNVAFISNRANRVKGSCTPDEFQKLAAYFTSTGDTYGPLSPSQSAS